MKNVLMYSHYKGTENWDICNLYIYIYIYNLKICYLKFHAMNDDFQIILKLSHNSNTLTLDKVWHVAVATNCPVGLLYN